jgi:16S rRNA G527 N7-methylase RsmG
VKLNLTGFDLHHLSDAALDRLVVEPLAAARLVRPEDLSVVDIGTGGGSPAVPFKLACPSLRATWFEARVRKTAFLREVVRALDLQNVTVAADVFGESTELSGATDLVTVRAVRLERSLLSAIRRSLTSGGRLLIFAKNGFTRDEFSMNTVPLWETGPEITVATPADV